MQIGKSFEPLPALLGGQTKSAQLDATKPANSFQGLLDQVQSLQQDANRQVKRTLVGEGDLHEAMLALEKANLSLKVLVQVRNKLVQAYEELSRMAM